MIQPTLPEPRAVPLGTTAHAMRAPCPDCGTTDGYIRPTGGQDVVRCNNCDRYCYAAPKHETGRAVRSVTTRTEIKPKRKATVRLRAGHRCELCGMPAALTAAGLSVDHILPYDVARKMGLSDEQINHIENLAAMCEECNLGKGNTTLPLWLAIAIVKARTASGATPEGGE